MELSDFIFEKKPICINTNNKIFWNALYKKTYQIVLIKEICNAPKNECNENNELYEKMFWDIISKKENYQDFLVPYIGAIHVDPRNYYLAFQKMCCNLDEFIFNYKTPFDLTFMKTSMIIIAQGLLLLSRNNIWYTDLKTNNILVSFDGNVKICDLGGCVYQNSEILTDFNLYLSTKGWSVPEIDYLSNKRQFKLYLYKVFVWGCGLILYKMIYGENLTYSYNDNKCCKPYQNYKTQVNEIQDTLDNLVPIDWINLLICALDPRPEERISFYDFIYELKNLSV